MAYKGLTSNTQDRPSPERCVQICGSETNLVPYTCSTFTTDVSPPLQPAPAGINYISYYFYNSKEEKAEMR